jgi:acetyl esterase/lipase
MLPHRPSEVLLRTRLPQWSTWLRLARVLCVAASWAPTWALAQAPQVPEGVLYEQDIEYGSGGGEPLKLDLARPKEGDGPFPGVVCIHGGGWAGGNKSFFRPLMIELAQKGYVAVTVQYRFAPKHPFPAQVNDVKCAVRWLRSKSKEFKLDPNRIGATGASAGGHLSLMLGVMGKDDGLEGEGGHSDQPSQVQAVVNFFGPTDLSREFPENVRPLLVNLVGGPLDEKQKEIRLASPVTYLSHQDPPILTFHGTKDNIVPYEHATILDEACKKLGISHELQTMPDLGHGWGGETLRKTLDQTIAFFDKHLKKLR